MASHQAVCVDPGWVGVGHQLDLHPGVAHIVVDLWTKTGCQNEGTRTRTSGSDEAAHLNGRVGSAVLLAGGPWEPTVGWTLAFVPEPEPPLEHIQAGLEPEPEPGAH